MSYDSLSTNAPFKFPHTTAQLAALARQHKHDAADHIDQRLVNQVVALLIDEREDDLKRILSDVFGIDDDSLEHAVLELMHKHRDDVAGVPFLFLTPTRRPISRPSSRASNTSRLALRPETPLSAPTSPLANLFRRPSEHHSPSSSPVLSHSSSFVAHSQFTASLPASPLSSPRLLNAKASEFRPIPRPLSAAATHVHPHASAASSSSLLLGLRADTPSPDMWAHSSTNSPRATSNLAIAAPLIADQTPPSAFTSRSVTSSPSLHHATPLRSSHRPKDRDDDEDDPFDPFSTRGGRSPYQAGRDPEEQKPFPMSFFPSNADADLDLALDSYYDEFDADDDPTAVRRHGPAHPSMTLHTPIPADDALTDGMTPFDVLTSIFGSTIAPSELEEALAANGFDFERAMGSLVDRALPAPGVGSVQGGGRGGISGRVTMVGRDTMVMPPAQGHAGRGRGGIPTQQQMVGAAATSATPGRPAQRFVNGRPVPNGNRVCRYFVAGECLRADCRFSHDLERALCRFWLRGTCAKNDTCEFLHHLPKDVDMNALNALLARSNVPPGTGPLAAHTLALAQAQAQGQYLQQYEEREFPALGAGEGRIHPNANGVNVHKHSYAYPNTTVNPNDTTRVRMPLGDSESINGLSNGAHPPNTTSTTSNATSNTSKILGAAYDNLHHPTAIIAPRPSPRIKLRPPFLLPSLTSTSTSNNYTQTTLGTMYASYRALALQLGSTRNTLLARAAEAWRRGDGAAAKRLSKEGQAMNERMREEMGGRAEEIVRERVRMVEGAVRERVWEGIAGGGREEGKEKERDRLLRGRVVGGGYGICLGVVPKTRLVSAPSLSSGISTAANPDSNAASDLSLEERTEVMIDLHGLHANEATDVLEKFLVGLEQERFAGLAYVVVVNADELGTVSGGVSVSGTGIGTGAGAGAGTGSTNNTNNTNNTNSVRLAMAVKEWLHRWGYPWTEREGVVCVDALTRVS